MSGDDGDPYVSCPAPACNRKGRRSVIAKHLAEATDQRHADYDGSELEVPTP